MLCVCVGDVMDVVFSGSGVNRVQVVLSRQKLYVGMVVCISWLYSYLCVCM